MAMKAISMPIESPNGEYILALGSISRVEMDMAEIEAETPLITTWQNRFGKSPSDFSADRFSLILSDFSSAVNNQGHLFCNSGARMD